MLISKEMASRDPVHIAEWIAGHGPQLDLVKIGEYVGEPYVLISSFYF